VRTLACAPFFLGVWFHPYLIPDLYNCKIFGWEVHPTDDSVHAALLERRTALDEGIAAKGRSSPCCMATTAPN
jgi:hypothetical protein